MNELIRVIAKRVLVTAGVLVIALALLVGAFRLVIAQLPGYQDELRYWVNAELGVEADFDAFDARLGLYGPELDLREVSLRAAGSSRDFLDAGRASLTLDPWALLFGQRVAISRLTLDGASLAIERTADGSVRVQGLEATAARRGDLASMLPQSLDVVIRDSRVLYIDRVERRFWQFTDFELGLERGPVQLTAQARATPPDELAERIELTAASTAGDTGLLEIAVRLADSDLATLARLVPDSRFDGVAGAGDIDFTGAWRDGRLEQARAAIAFTDVTLAGDAGFEQLAFDAEWTRASRAGFAVTVQGLDVVRDGRSWPGDGRATLSVADGGELVAATADFIRLEDLRPLIERFAPAGFAAEWAANDPRGDLDDLQLSADDGAFGRDYSLETGFRRFSMAAQDGRPGVSGLDGEIRAGAGSGTVSFASGSVSLAWPGVLAAPIDGTGLRGTVVWRLGQEGLRILSDDLRVELFAEPVVANFELGLPADGSSPYLDLHGRAAQLALEDAKTLLPQQGLPAVVTRWLREALLGGVGRDVTVEFTGALDAFPFEDGSGRLLVQADVVDATIDFIAGWPLAEDLSGSIRFENAGFTADGSGRVLGSTTEDLRVEIADMRAPVLEIDATVGGSLGDVLDFVQTAPLITRHLGPGFNRLHATAGDAVTTIDLDLPLLSFADFELASRLDMTDGRLRIDGFSPEASEIDGTLQIVDSTVSGEGIGAVFLGGPVTAAVSSATQPGYRTLVSVSGETGSDAILDAFALPLGDLVDGQTLWSGRLLLPRTESADPGPLTIEVESNLSGMALRFPEPLAKPPGEATNLQVEFVFDGDQALAIDGNLGATRRFEFLLDRRDDIYAVSRGAVAFGGIDPLLPLRDGIAVSGRIPQLRLDDWLGVARSSSIDRARPLFLSADLEIAEFDAFGQQLGETRLSVQRGDRVWDIDLDSAAIAGHIEVPQNLAYRGPVIADMERVYLALGERPADPGDLDPRELPGLRLRAAEFGFGARELGSVEVDVVADTRGLRLTSFTSATDNHSLEASGSWLADGSGSTTRIAATVTSSDVAATLDQLGIEPVVEGESGELTASIYWNGPPSSGWLDHLNGDVALSVRTGSMIEIDPGAGRVVGLMSIAALPRRLMLDFRDVFNKGFSFDEITGSFTIADGNAFTDDLKLSGPTAEIGVIGRTGLRDRDYQQQAVVTAEPSNMLPTVGGLLGGPGVGAALLIFTRIFKEPLKGIGRASYCVTGSWDNPNVERITADRSDGAEQCVSLPELMARGSDGG